MKERKKSAVFGLRTSVVTPAERISAGHCGLGQDFTIALLCASTGIENHSYAEKTQIGGLRDISPLQRHG